jgi:tRNA/tmRNA/rRNA uracil-C5-methylase (TrmA/RlmC/RlmD family)
MAHDKGVIKLQTQCLPAREFKQIYDLMLIDPPRSGFSDLLGSLPTLNTKPKWILALHCHKKGLLSDLPLIKSAGYRLLDWSATDIFPATPYQEHISLWSL